jgi:hypothetical protein
MSNITPFSPRDSIFRTTTISEVYQAITGYSASTHLRGDRALVRCPAADHADTHPSCYLLLSTNSWCCFSCPTAFSNLPMGKRTRTIAELVIYSGNAHTVQEAAVFLERILNHNLSRPLKDQPKPKIGQGVGTHEKLENEKRVATYPYEDEQGKTLYKILRYEGTVPKSAAEIHHKAKNGKSKRFVMVGNSKRRVPYKLPLIIAAARAGRSIIVNEGENKADWLESVGFAATAWAFGSNSPFDISWVRYFDGAPYVFFLSDADQVGRLAMRRAASLIAAPGRTCITIDLFPDRTDASDVLNWAADLGLIGSTSEIKTRAHQAVRTMLNSYAKVQRELDTASTRTDTYLESEIA